MRYRIRTGRHPHPPPLADGIFQFGSKFSKTLRFSDINYAIASKEDKTAMFLDYSELLNALDAGSTTKITINNKRVNREDFEREILLPRQDDALDGYRAEYNAMLMDKVTDSSNSVAQERYITLSVHRKSVEEARTFFDRVVHDVTSRLNHLDSTARNWTQWSACGCSTTSTAPGRRRSTTWICGSVCAAATPSRTPSAGQPGIQEGPLRHGEQVWPGAVPQGVCQLHQGLHDQRADRPKPKLMLSIDIIPVPTDEAVRELQNRLLGVETNVTNWQRRQNSNNNFSAIVPYDLEQQRKETREMLDDLTTP